MSPEAALVAAASVLLAVLAALSTMELALAVTWPALDCSEDTMRDADWAIEPPVVLGAEEDMPAEAEPEVADAPEADAEPEQPAAVG